MKKKRLLIILAVIVVLAAGGVYFTTRSTASRADASVLLANATLADVVQTTLVTSVDSTGSLIPEATLNLSFGASGTVNAVKVQVGDRVQKGQVLATLDTSDLDYQVTKAQQAYLLQQLTYSNTIEADPNDVAVAQASYNSAAAAYSAAQQDYSQLSVKESVQCSSLTSAKAALDRAQTAYDRIANDHQASQYLNADWGPYTQIVKALEDAQDAYTQAVSNCNVTKLSLNDSSLRSAQAQVQSGSSAAVSIADTSRLHVDVLVDETEIAAIQVGQDAQITLDALTGITLTGKVANIAPAGTVSSGVVNYNVRVNLDATDAAQSAALKLDMTANASIIGEKHENVLSVPTLAIRTMTARSQTNAATTTASGTVSSTASSMVMVVQNGQPRPVPVTVGMTAGDLTEVSGDLQVGDQVVLKTTTTSTSNTQDFGGPPDGGFGGPPPDMGGGAGGPPPGF
jgi:macrolide-specific efflux system membrane fusion protein